jgi:hypothetical protein
MATFPRTFEGLAASIVRPLGRILTAVVGFAIGMVGLAMCVTIVMLPLGVTVGLIGIALLLCGLFAPPLSTDA